MGRAVAIHPLAVIVAIAAGIVLAGIIGALIAVPIVAVLNTGIRHLAALRRAEETGEPGPGDPPTGPPAPGRPAGQPVHPTPTTRRPAGARSRILDARCPAARRPQTSEVARGGATGSATT